jgi:predicted nucleic-acid-binding Zn-ribbon protein
MVNNKNCYSCGKVKLNKTEIGLSKKFLNINTNVFYCIECLAEYLEVDVEFLLEKVEEFKSQGCSLFD